MTTLKPGDILEQEERYTTVGGKEMKYLFTRYHADRIELINGREAHIFEDCTLDYGEKYGVTTVQKTLPVGVDYGEWCERVRQRLEDLYGCKVIDEGRR